MSNQVIEFGKYKGQPLEVLINDPQYTQWLLAQEWFASKFRDQYNIVINNFMEPQDSKEHNQIHVKFLSDDYIKTKFSQFISDNGCHLEWLKDEVYSEKESLLLDVSGNIKPFEITKKRFESIGFDVVVYVDIVYEKSWVYPDDFGKSKYIDPYRGSAQSDDFYTMEAKRGSKGNAFEKTEHQLFIEIKPSVSDDFPSVLRQMKRNMRTRDYGDPQLYYFLLVGEYIGQGATEQQFIDFFANEGVIVVFDK